RGAHLLPLRRPSPGRADGDCPPGSDGRDSRVRCEMTHHPPSALRPRPGVPAGGPHGGPPPLAVLSTGLYQTVTIRASPMYGRPRPSPLEGPLNALRRVLSARLRVVHV